MNNPSVANAMVGEPIDMVLYCPKCGLQHIDAPEHDMRDDYPVVAGLAFVSKDYKPWTNPPHRSHLCHGCKHVWRPADVPTNGVASIATKGENDSPKVTAGYAATITQIAAQVPLLENSTHGPRLRCQHCGYATVIGDKPEHWKSCAWVAACAQVERHPLDEQIAQARKEVAEWSPEKRATMRLQGGSQK